MFAPHLALTYALIDDVGPPCADSGHLRDELAAVEVCPAVCCEERPRQSARTAQSIILIW